MYLDCRLVGDGKGEAPSSRLLFSSTGGPGNHISLLTSLFPPFFCVREVEWYLSSVSVDEEAVIWDPNPSILAFGDELSIGKLFSSALLCHRIFFLSLSPPFKKLW